MTWPHRTDEHEDRGSASLAMVLLAPVLVVLMFMGFQAAMWNHARTEARVIAREAAVLVARDGASAGAAQSAASASLAGDAVLANTAVTVTVSGEYVTVTITGDAPGIIRGTSRPVSVSAAVPLEGWVGL
jgi:Flp pilus assembly protein TadG